MEGEFILKVQRPLYTTEKTPVALLNNESKSFITTIPMYLIGHAIPDSQVRIFYYARLDAGQLTLDRVAPSQDW